MREIKKMRHTHTHKDTGLGSETDLPLLVWTALERPLGITNSKFFTCHKQKLKSKGREVTASVLCNS